MDKFVNEYEYNEAVIKESMQAWCRNKFKRYWIEMPILFVITIVLYLLTGEVLCLIASFISALAFLLTFVNQKKAVKVEQERTEVTYKGIVPTLQITIAEDIYTVSPQVERHLDFTSVEKILETKNLIVLLLKGNMTITLCKTGFTEGTWENCLTYLKNMIKR
ncbi:MAG: hypothetical protein IJN54_15715 [Lachnospiraceae bacterium]|nr:hypothetical protein [Lachnospiraceae bacterium]